MIDSKKDYYIFFLLLFISISSNILKNLRESVVISQIGIEAIMILKICGIFPLSFIIIAIYNFLSKKQYFIYIFYTSFTISILYFLFFTIPTLNIEGNSFTYKSLHSSWAIYIACLKSWDISLFFILSEICGDSIFSLLYWQLLSMIYTRIQAAKIYPMLGIFSNIGAFIAGLIIFNTQTIKFNFKYSLNFLEVYLYLILMIHIIIIFLFLRILKYIKLNKNIHQSSNSTHKTSLLEILKIKNKNLLYIASIVFFNGLTLNFIDLIFKDALFKEMKSISTFSKYLGMMTIANALVAFVCCFLASKVIPKIGWYKSALLSPVLLLTTSIAFLYFCLLTCILRII